jgi:hypothetical protein
MNLFILSSIVSLFIALQNGLPDTNLRLTIVRSVLLLTPFNAFVITALYLNDGSDFFKWTLVSLSVLVAINLIGYYGLGLINLTHSIEGRLSFPFLDAFYSGANVLAIINLMLLFYLRKAWTNPIQFALLGSYFMVNLVLFYLINSRLAMLIFLLVLMLILFRAIKMKSVYWISLFTLPILLSSGLLLYEILKVPALASVMQRVDIEDVTTFHGRSYLWEDALNWLFYDQRGLLLGNGYKGHFFLDLIHDVVKLWNAEAGHYLHLHSTSLEILVSQGVLFFIIYCVIFYRAHVYYRQRNELGGAESAFLPVIVFLLIMMQVDTFLYLDSPGSIILALLVSRASVSYQLKISKPNPIATGILVRNHKEFQKLPTYDQHSSARS